MTIDEPVSSAKCRWWRSPLELEVDAPVHDPLAVEPVGHAGAADEVDRALLEHPRADSPLHVVARAVLEDDRLDPLAREEPREREPRGPRPDDRDLSPHAAGPA